MDILIVEDEAPAFRRLELLLKEVRSDIRILEVTDSIADTVSWLQQNKQPDLIFMDMQLADGLSLEIFGKVQVASPVIFTTAHDEYALRAFKVSSIDYLLKPLLKAELENSLNKYELLKASLGSAHTTPLKLEELLQVYQQQGSSYKSRILVKLGDRLISVDEKDIAYFQATDGLVFLVTRAEKRYPLDRTLDELEGMLNPESFFRINRQFIVRVDALGKISSYFKGKLVVELNPQAGDKVIISREKATTFKQWLGSI